jgi:hypothetical protein
MKQKIMRGVWSAGVVAGLVAGTLAAVSTPAVAFAQYEEVCRVECYCNEHYCICARNGCSEIPLEP